MSYYVVTVREPGQEARVFTTEYDEPYEAIESVCQYLDFPGYDGAKLEYGEDEGVAEYKEFILEATWCEGTMEVYL